LDSLATKYDIRSLQSPSSIDLILYILQFLAQEPHDDDAIGQFCTLNYGVTFPIMKKSDVNGDNANDVYKYLKAQKSGLFGLTRIKVPVVPSFPNFSIQLT
jgi:glutathione peroxidase-family protein